MTKSYVLHEKFPATKDGMIQDLISVRILFIPAKDKPQFYVDRKGHKTNDCTLIESFYSLVSAMELFQAEYKDLCLKLEMNFPVFRG